MITIKIEGFTITSDINEAAPYNRMYECNDMDSFIGELSGIVLPVIEDVIIGGETIANYYCRKCRGYRDSRLEPFNWRETKKAINILYTGAMGGDPYRVQILKD